LEKGRQVTKTKEDTKLHDGHREAREKKKRGTPKRFQGGVRGHSEQVGGEHLKKGMFLVDKVK